MQSPVLSFVVLQAVASTLAANLMTPSDTDTYSCTVLSNVYSDWCCVQVQSYPADANLSPGATVYNHIRKPIRLLYVCPWSCHADAPRNPITDEAISSNNVSYGTETTFYSNLYYTVELTANYRNETMARDNSSFWCAGARYGAYDKADADLAVLNVSAVSTTGAALTAAY